MDDRRATRCSHGGGTSIPTLRPPRARLIAGILAFLVAVAIAAVSLDVRSSGLVFASGVLGAAILVLLAAALALGHPGWIGPVVGLLGALYLGHVLVAAEANIATAGFVGVALLLVGELAQWSFDGRLRGRYAASMHTTRALGLAGLVLFGAGAVVLSLLVVGLPVSGGLVTVVVGTAAFVAVVALVSGVARRPA